MVNVVPFGRVVSEVDIRADQLWSELELLSVSQKRGVVPRSEVSDKEARAEDLSNYKRCWVNDIVLNRMSAYQGALGIARQEGIVSPDYAVLRPRASMDAQFLTYLMKSEWFVGQMTSRLRGIGSPGTSSVRTPRVNIQDLRDIDLPLPPVEEQRRIADFLDDQVGRIDEAVRLHEAQLTMVEQLRITAISQVMTEWRVPLPHEGTRRLATLLERNDGGVWGEDPIGADGVVVLRSTEIDRFGNWRALDDAALRSLSERDQEVGRLRVGDILVTKASGSPDHIGKAAIVTDQVASLRPCFGNFMQRLRVREGLTSPSFVHRFLMSSLAREQFRIMSTTSTGLLNLSGGLLSDVRIPDLSLEDQHRVVQEIEKLDADLTALAGALERGIQVFEERKRALITAAVKGELDVTTAKPIGMGKWVPNVGAGVENPAAAQASSIGGIG